MSFNIEALAMYKLILAGCVIGFGLGIILTTMLFEVALSTFGNTITIDYTTWDWNSQTNNWKLIGILWILAGLVTIYFLYKSENK